MATRPIYPRPPKEVKEHLWNVADRKAGVTHPGYSNQDPSTVQILCDEKGRAVVDASLILITGAF